MAEAKLPRIPRLRPIWWVLIIGLIAIIPLAITFTINIIFEDLTWWLTGGLAIFEAFVGLVAFVIWMIVRIQGAVPTKIKLTPADAKEKVIEAIKMDEDNPDNFIPESQIIKRVGEPGQARTPILWLHGRGSETNTQIDVIVNLDNPKLEMSRLDGATPQEVDKAIREMAEFPEKIEVSTSTTSLDAFNRPIQTTEVRRVSQAEKQAIKEKEEAEKANQL